MRHTLLIVMLLLVAGLAVGCTSKDGSTPAEPEHHETTAAQGDNTPVVTEEAAQAAEDYSYAKKAEFIAKMKEELARMQVEIDRLSAKVDRSSGATKAEAQAKLAALREKSAQLKKKLDAAEGATASTWDSVKKDFRTSFGEFKASIKKTRQWLGEKIEP